MDSELGFDVQINQPYEQAVEQVVAALEAEGFGVLTRIDVKATMKEKLGANFRPYVILGACNPPLAHRALSTDGSVGLILPCNVTVEASSGDTTLARFANPEMMIQVGSLGQNPVLREVAGEARSRLERAANSLR